MISTLTGLFDGVELGPQEMRVRLYCGDSRHIFVILPSRPCEPRDCPIELEVSVTGIATATASFAIVGRSC